MDLNNIRLPNLVIEELYRDSLIEEPSDRSSFPQNEKLELPFKFLGDNLSRTCILVNNPTDTFLPDNQLELLIKLLSACNLTLADVAIINFGSKTQTITQIREMLSPQKALLLGVTPSQLDLPFEFPLFKLQEHGGCIFIQAPSLETMVGDSEESKEIKTKLWNCLKQMFGISKKR